MTQFQALGGLTFSDNGHEGGVGGPRQRRLVAMLLIHRNAVVSVDRLADAVFEGEPTAAASTTLRSYVARLRKVIDGNGSGVTLQTKPPGYVLLVPDQAFDVGRFESLLAEGNRRLEREDFGDASSVLREALERWRGDPYVEFADEEWARPEAQRLAELRLVAEERLIDAELASGRAAELIPKIEALVDEHPLREAFRAQLVTALYRAGRQVDALRVVKEYRRQIVEELGIDPSPSLSELERRVLTHDSTLMVPAAGGSPLRGYLLGERLGTGRDGTVSVARVPGVERDLVIRVFREEIADRSEFVRTFEATAHQVASLRRSAIVPIYDYWREPGAAYLVMRRMHGGTLGDQLRRGALPAAAVASVVRRIGDALAAAAEAGIAHGRLSADCIFYDEAGNCYLSDFALGRSGPAHSAGNDVDDFAALVEECLTGHAPAQGPGVAGDVAAVLGRGRSTIGRPRIGEFVRELAVVLSADGAELAQLPPNPYKGLRAFDESDAADFFGRDVLIDGLVNRLAGDDVSGRLVLVVGGSGTGKSSVVRAGLLPRVRAGGVPGSERWFVATMLPGSSPFKELAESLEHVAVAESPGLAEQLADGDGGIDDVVRRLIPDDGQLLLVVDQFEELFTLATEHDQRGFLDGLMHAVSAPDSRLRVVATLRADFYDRPLAFQRFGAAVNRATVTITAMSPADLEAAIVEPAERVGVRVDAALVAELVSAVVDEPAALPSLQFALFELSERSATSNLTLAAYRDLDGVDGAIATRAEQLYQSLDDAERATVRKLFERFVVVGSEGEPTRRRADRTELSRLSADSTADATIDHWAQARLLTLDRHPQTRVPTAELAHEALLREWPRLSGWIEESRGAIVVRGQLREAARSWVDLGRDDGTLYRGARLQIATDLADQHTDDLPPLEREFLDASRAVRDHEQREAAQLVVRQARANRRLRIQLAAIGIALVVALIGGFFAVDQRGEAQQERRVATARELAAASEASLADDPERSILLALAAIDETRSSDGSVLPEAGAALHRAVTASRIVLSVPGVGGALDWSPSGEVFVTEGPEESGVIDIRDAVTGESVRSWHGHDIDVNDVEFSGDGSMLATAGDDGAVRVWDPNTGEELMAVLGVGSVWNPSFTSDGSRLVARWPDWLIRVADVTTGEVLNEFEMPSGGSADLSPDGSQIVLDLRVLDVRSGEQVAVLDGDFDWADPYAWSPDGKWIAAATVSPSGDESETQVWDATTGERHATLESGPAHRLDWTADSTRLATSSTDGAARVWEIDAESARELFRFSARDLSRSSGGVAFSPDGNRLMVGDSTNTAVTIYDLSIAGGREWANVPDGVPGLPGAASFTPDGRQLVTSSEDGAAVFWDAESGDRTRLLGAGRIAVQLEMSPDGGLVAGTDWDRTPVMLWDVASGTHVSSALPESSDPVWGLAWSPDGTHLAIIHGPWEQREVSIVDRAGALLTTLRPQEDGVEFTSASFSGDGRLLATIEMGLERSAPNLEHISIWDWALGEVVRTIDTQAHHVTFDPTGDRLASSRNLEGVLDVWDAATGEHLTTLTGHSGLVNDITFSRNGSMVATASADGTARVWDPTTGSPVHVLRDSTSVAVVAFSPDGSKLASVSSDGIARVWALDLDDLIAIANERLTRGFTDDECRRYLHLERCPEA